MAKRLRDRCGLCEDKTLWKSGRAFIVRDLPWTEDKLRKLPPFEFENWAVIAIGGTPNKAKVGDMGIDGKLFPVHTLPEKPGKKKAHDHLDFEFWTTGIRSRSSRRIRQADRTLILSRLL